MRRGAPIYDNTAKRNSKELGKVSWHAAKLSVHIKIQVR